MERCVILHFTLTLSFTFRHILLIAMDKYSFICINAADASEPSENEEIIENVCVCGLDSGYGEGKINFEI